MDILVTENTKDHKESRMPTLKKNSWRHLNNEVRQKSEYDWLLTKNSMFISHTSQVTSSNQCLL